MCASAYNGLSHPARPGTGATVASIKAADAKACGQQCDDYDDKGKTCVSFIWRKGIPGDSRKPSKCILSFTCRLEQLEEARMSKTQTGWLEGYRAVVWYNLRPTQYYKYGDCCDEPNGNGTTCDGACGACNDDISCLDACGVPNGDGTTCGELSPPLPPSSFSGDLRARSGHGRPSGGACHFLHLMHATRS